MDLLMDDEAHQSRVQLATLPAAVGLLSLVASLVGLQVRPLVETSVTLRAVHHLPACVCRAARVGPAGPDVRMILCRGEVRHEANPRHSETSSCRGTSTDLSVSAQNPHLETGSPVLPATDCSQSV